LVLGLSPDEERRYDGVIKLHLAPFLGLYRLAKKNLERVLKSSAGRATKMRLFADHSFSILSKPSN